METEQAINKAISSVGPDGDVASKGTKRKRDDAMDKEEIEEDDGVLTLCSIDEKKRFQIRQVNAIRNLHPEAYQRAISFGEDPFAQLEDAQLREFLGILKEEAGLAGPYDDAKAITALVGNVVEKMFGLGGVATLLSSDPDIISCVYELLPTKMKNLGPAFQIFSKVLDVMSIQYKTAVRHIDANVKENEIRFQREHTASLATAIPKVVPVVPATEPQKLN